MASTEEIRATLDRYLQTFSNDDAAGWAGCFAEDATQEDPVGSPVNTGRAAIQQFYENTSAMFGGGLTLELRGEPVIIGNEAALAATAVAGKGDARARIPNIIDLLTFNDAAEITSLRAFWTIESLVPEPE